ncbi:energy transducer TonB [Lysobacter soli]|uniref:energy transducer TonB n=1 Tax=Lysobacter soli TaxID=453783 RepID=UPI0037C99B4D
MKHCINVSMAAVLALSLTACATLETDAGDSISALAYNRGMATQGPGHYCGAGQCDRPPKLVSAVAPTYPTAALRAERNGQATVVFFIDESGAVSDPTLESATSPDFGQAALKAVRSWKYRPASRAGKPVRVGPMRQIIPFELEKDG